METKNQPISALNWENQSSLVDMLNGLEQKCKRCNPLTPITCVTECKTWRLKNQFRKISERMQEPNFLEHLLNTLKNRRRLQILDLISRQGYSISQLRQKLASLGYHHSQQTIVDEYISPLVKVGLAQESENPYHATVLGCKVNELVKNFRDLEIILPPHSECYEESTLDALLEDSRTYQDMGMIIPVKSVARVLSRLERTALVETRKEKAYVFLFKTRRNPHLESFSPTERRIYENIPTDGISAKRLSDRTRISMRRTYKYLRKLKGKKLVFTRKEPLAYSLTAKGSMVASMLRAIRSLATETQTLTAQFLGDGEMSESRPLKADTTREKDEEAVTMTDTPWTQRH